MLVHQLEITYQFTFSPKVGHEPDYLPKPFNPVLLRARLTACLERKRLRDQEVDYLQQVGRVTVATAAIKANTFQDFVGE